MLYGRGGVGKTSLAANAPGPVVFLDLDGSLDMLAGRLPPGACALSGVVGWKDLRDALRSEAIAGCATVVLDSITRAETLAVEYTLATVKRESGVNANSVEDYGYGKGYQHVYETMLLLFGDLDALYRAGKNIVVVAHECSATIPNPAGPDFLRWEPRVQAPNSGKASVRNLLTEWCDHLAYLGYDMAAVVDPKKAEKPAKDIGTYERRIFLNPRGHFAAKTRSVVDSEIVYQPGGAEFWAALLPKK